MRNAEIAEKLNLKSSDKKESYKDPFNPTWITSSANVPRFLSKKLLVWGVEARGAYHILTSERDLVVIRDPLRHTPS